MADEKKCDRCGVVEDAEHTSIIKVNVGILGRDEILVPLAEVPFKQDLCKKCREVVGAFLKKPNV